jgi:hypothetical protein
VIERAVIAAVILAVAVVIAALIRRRAPTGPPRDSFPAPRAVQRSDFVRPDAPWLVAVFTSATCGSCPDVAATVATFASESVAVSELTYEAARSLHQRYGVSGVPMTLVVDEEGVVRASFVGPLAAADLRAALAGAGAPDAGG